MVAANEAIDIHLVPAHDNAVAARLLKRASYLHSNQPERLRWICTHPDTPTATLFTLLQYPTLRTDLAHRSEPLELLETLAEAYQIDEAILTVAKRYYTDARFTVEEFSEFLNAHAANEWLLTSLCYATSTIGEKEAALRSTIMATKRLDLQRILAARDSALRARATEDPQELQALYDPANADVCLALASNPATPVSLLEELKDIRDVKRASDIRRAAADNLVRRE